MKVNEINFNPKQSTKKKKKKKKICYIKKTHII